MGVEPDLFVFNKLNAKSEPSSGFDSQLFLEWQTKVTRTWSAAFAFRMLCADKKMGLISVKYVMPFRISGRRMMSQITSNLEP